MTRKHILFVGILLFLTMGAFQPFGCKTDISGTVTDVDGNPISGATVSIDVEGIDEITTDSNGMYVFENVPYGEHTICVISGKLRNYIIIDTSYIKDGLSCADSQTDFVLTDESWSEYENNPGLNTTSKDGFASVVKVGDTYHMYYSWDNVNHATSTDGKTWIVDTANNPVVTDAGVPMAWKEGTTWYMLYRAGLPSTVNMATSTDGVNWTKSSNNPIFEDTIGWAGSGGIEAWGIIKIDSIYYMFYSNWGTGRAIGLATSTDLINWTKDSNNPIFTGGRFCGFPFKYGNYYYFLVPHYTSGTNYSQIELYRDTVPTFHSDNREFVKIAINYGISGSWNGKDQDTPFVLTDNIYRDSFNLTNNQLWTYFAGSPTGGDTWYTGLTIETDIADALKK